MNILVPVLIEKIYNNARAAHGNKKPEKRACLAQSRFLIYAVKGNTTIDYIDI